MRDQSLLAAAPPYQKQLARPMTRLVQLASCMTMTSEKCDSLLFRTAATNWLQGPKRWWDSKKSRILPTPQRRQSPCWALQNFLGKLAPSPCKRPLHSDTATTEHNYCIYRPKLDCHPIAEPKLGFVRLACPISAGSHSASCRRLMLCFDSGNSTFTEQLAFIAPRSNIDEDLSKDEGPLMVRLQQCAVLTKMLVTGKERKPAHLWDCLHRQPGDVCNPIQ